MRWQGSLVADVAGHVGDRETDDLAILGDPQVEHVGDLDLVRDQGGARPGFRVSRKADKGHRAGIGQ